MMFKAIKLKWGQRKGHGPNQSWHQRITFISSSFFIVKVSINLEAQSLVLNINLEAQSLD